MRNKLIRSLSILTILLLPVLVYGQDFENAKGIVNGFLGLINTLIPITFALILLVFLWGLVKYVANAGNESAQAQGRRLMISGIIALFVGLSIWGIIDLIRSDLGISQETAPDAPQAPSGGGTF